MQEKRINYFQREFHPTNGSSIPHSVIYYKPRKSNKDSITSGKIYIFQCLHFYFTEDFFLAPQIKNMFGNRS